ncbi:hypothetical protein GCM10028820_16660 [Tessaracoccus terricola]
MSNHLGTGLVLVTVRGAGGLPGPVEELLTRSCDAPPAMVGGVWVGTWGLGRSAPTQTEPVLLTSTNQSASGTVAPAEIARWLAAGDLTRLGRMLPPFGALGLTPNGLRLTTDQIAFRNVFRCEGDGWSAASTSALLLARMLGRGLDPKGLRLQSQLGYQLDSLTIFDGVTALAPRESLELSAAGIRSEWIPEPDEQGALPLDEGVQRAAQGLRDMVSTYLDEGHDPTLQLTGGQDSRIVLSAVPAARRRGLKVMTLETPGSKDAEIAGALARRFGMRHTVHSISGIGSLSPEEWFHRVLATAESHDCMADPIARSITGWAEESFEQGQRLSGLGGELARGFFYFGTVRPAPITRSRSQQLARWRMLANDAVEGAALAAEYRDAHSVSVDVIHATLLESGPEWFSATDALYLDRIRRWGGLGEGAVAFRRTLVNPMLDHRFTETVPRITPAGKQGSRFLGRLQVALDDELASLPLDDRPAPRVYAHPGPLNLLRTKAARFQKLVRKVNQRVRGTRRPPAGAALVSAAITRHIHDNPTVLDPARASGVFDEAWLEEVSSGSTAVSAANLALLMNLVAAGREGAL